jgi:cobalt-zinc-cadmium efflux system protein
MHDHRHHDYPHTANSRPMVWALVVTLSFASVEAGTGWWANSLALMGDAGHMLTDAAALAIAAVAAWAVGRPASNRHTYGYARAELLAAFVNSLFMLAIVTGIAAAAVDRLRTPLPVSGEAVTGVAVLGLIVNLLVARLLHDGHSGDGSGADLNRRAAFLHVLGDLLGSVAAIAAGLIVTYTGWNWADPLLSLVICVLILISSVSLVRQALHALLDGTPPSLDLADIGNSLAGTAGVVSVHDLHVWSLNSARTILTAHVVVDDLSDWAEVLPRLKHAAHTRFGIDHATFQPEPASSPVHFLTRTTHAPVSTPTPE